LSDSIGITAFDPNHITESEWIALGLSPKVAKTAVNYIKSGGNFKRAEDISKVYGISSDDVDRLIPYIIIPDSAQPIRIQDLSEIEIELTANGEIDINQATLEQISNCGITSALAWKIINYRDKLGGYYSLLQLNELKGVDSLELYLAMECFKVESKNLKQIRINHADFTELANHPYLSDRHARAIIRYRDSTGYYRSIYEITRAYRISPQYLGKLKNYLSL
jgi:DNA uptake protein ComE-like DNA-binding protein